MNQKHIGCLLILFLCVLAVQGLMIVRKNAVNMQAAAETARRDAEAAAVALRAQSAIVDDLTRKSSDLLEYLEAWEPHLSRFTTQESAELDVSALIKQADLILLAQRFEVAPNKSKTSVPNSADGTIPQIVRAHLAIEDDFIKSINWLGELESRLPSGRISNLELARGQSGNDVRMNLVLDVPLARPRAKPSPTP